MFLCFSHVESELQQKKNDKLIHMLSNNRERTETYKEEVNSKTQGDSRGHVYTEPLPGRHGHSSSLSLEHQKGKRATGKGFLQLNPYSSFHSKLHTSLSNVSYMTMEVKGKVTSTLSPMVYLQHGEFTENGPLESAKKFPGCHKSKPFQEKQKGRDEYKQSQGKEREHLTKLNSQSTILQPTNCPFLLFLYCFLQTNAICNSQGHLYHRRKACVKHT